MRLGLAWSPLGPPAQDFPLLCASSGYPDSARSRQDVDRPLKERAVGGTWARTTPANGLVSLSLGRVSQLAKVGLVPIVLIGHQDHDDLGVGRTGRGQASHLVGIDNSR